VLYQQVSIRHENRSGPAARQPRPEPAPAGCGWPSSLQAAGRVARAGRLLSACVPTCATPAASAGHPAGIGCRRLLEDGNSAPDCCCRRTLEPRGAAGTVAPLATGTVAPLALGTASLLATRTAASIAAGTAVPLAVETVAAAVGAVATLAAGTVAPLAVGTVAPLVAPSGDNGGALNDGNSGSPDG
jgi:hypothetical protein